MFKWLVDQFFFLKLYKNVVDVLLQFTFSEYLKSYFIYQRHHYSRHFLAC